MRRLFLPLFAFLLCLGGFVAANAQPNRSQSREIEWKNYALPQTNFTRKIDADKTLIFRVPADWQQDANELTFKSPEHALLKVLIQKIPEGYPVQATYLADEEDLKPLSSLPEFKKLLPPPEKPQP